MARVSTLAPRVLRPCWCLCYRASNKLVGRVLTLARNCACFVCACARNCACYVRACAPLQALPEKHLEALKHFKLHTTAKTKGWNALHYACAAHRVGACAVTLAAAAVCACVLWGVRGTAVRSVRLGKLV